MSTKIEESKTERVNVLNVDEKAAAAAAARLDNALKSRERLNEQMEQIQTVDLLSDDVRVVVVGELALAKLAKSIEFNAKAIEAAQKGTVRVPNELAVVVANAVAPLVEEDVEIFAGSQGDLPPVGVVPSLVVLVQSGGEWSAGRNWDTGSAGFQGQLRGQVTITYTVDSRWEVLTQESLDRALGVADIYTGSGSAGRVEKTDNRKQQTFRLDVSYEPGRREATLRERAKTDRLLAAQLAGDLEMRRV